jgi:hypothetical protein
MGQAQESSNKSALIPVPSLKYEVDPHLIDSETILPSSFSFAIQKMITEVEAFSCQIDEHPIEHYLIHAIDHRFSSNEIDE